LTAPHTLGPAPVITERRLSRELSPVNSSVPVPLGLAALTGAVIDNRNRQLRDLRISVTDRCNFRCVYCMPKEVFGRDFTFIERAELLTFEER